MENSKKTKNLLFILIACIIGLVGIDDALAATTTGKIWSKDCPSYTYDYDLLKKYSFMGDDVGRSHNYFAIQYTKDPNRVIYCLEKGVNLDSHETVVRTFTSVGKVSDSTKLGNIAKAIAYGHNDKTYYNDCGPRRIATGTLIQMINAAKKNSSGKYYWKVLDYDDIVKLVTASEYEKDIASYFVTIRDKVLYHDSMPFSSNDYASTTKDTAKSKTTNYFSVSGSNFTKTLSSSLFDIDYDWEVDKKDTGIDSAKIEDGKLKITAPISGNRGKTLCVRIKKKVATGTLYTRTSTKYQDTGLLLDEGTTSKYIWLCFKSSYIQVYKKDAETGTKLANVKFKLYSNKTCTTVAKNVSGTSFGEKTTSSSGYAYFYNMKNGTYYVKETAVPDGYIKDSTCRKVTVSSGGGKITISNKPVELKITKKDSSTGKILAGTKFQLYKDEKCKTVASNAQGKTFTAAVTNKNGIVSFKYLKKNTTYYIGEVTATAGYLKDTSWCKKVEVSSNPTTTITKEFSNAPVQIKIRKVDAANKTKGLAGASITLYTKNSCKDVVLAQDVNGNPIKGKTTDSNGWAYFNKIKVDTSQVSTDSNGNYLFYAKESSPPNGYATNEENENCKLHVVKVNPKTGIGEYTFENDKISSTSIQVLKRDKYDNAIVLPGVKITLYKDKTCKKGSEASDLVAEPTKTTDKRGMVLWNDINMTGLTSLKLYVMENPDSVPEGYIQEKENNCKEVTITKSDIVGGEEATGTAKNSVTIYNVPFGDIQILKLDSETRKPLKGVIFSLVDKKGNPVKDKDGNVVKDVTTNAEGVVKFSNLLYGTYYIKEVNTLEGYEQILDLIEFELNHNTDSIKLETLKDLVYYVGDVDTNGEVDVDDVAKLTTMIANNETLGITKKEQYSSDINEDGFINDLDLKVLDLFVNKKEDVEKYKTSLKTICGTTDCTLDVSFLKKISYVGTLDNTQSSNVCYSQAVSTVDVTEEEITNPDTSNPETETPGEVTPDTAKPEIINPDNSEGPSNCKFTSDSVIALEKAIAANETSGYTADFNDDKVVNDADVRILNAYLTYKEGNKLAAINDYIEAEAITGELDSATLDRIDKVSKKVTVDSDSIELHSSLIITNTLIDMKISKLDITNQEEVEGAEIVIKDSEGKEFIKFTSTKEVKRFNIPAGTYTLTETVAPEGYYKLKNEIKFEVLADGNIKLISAKSDSYELIASNGEFDKDTDHLIIYNGPVKLRIPDTGTAALFVTIIVGTGLIGYGGYTFYKRYRNA